MNAQSSSDVFGLASTDSFLEGAKDIAIGVGQVVLCGLAVGIAYKVGCAIGDTLSDKMGLGYDQSHNPQGHNQYTPPAMLAHSEA